MDENNIQTSYPAQVDEGQIDPPKSNFKFWLISGIVLIIIIMIFVSFFVIKKINPTSQNSINGSCGVPYPNCAPGNSVKIAMNHSGLYWKCEGINGGNNDFCSEEGDYRFVTVKKGGGGSGTVTSNYFTKVNGITINGINCGSLCTWVWDKGSIIILTASPSPGSIFSNWIGSTCSRLAIGEGPNSCAFSLDTNMNVTAIFNLSST